MYLFGSDQLRGLAVNVSKPLTLLNNHSSRTVYKIGKVRLILRLTISRAYKRKTSEAVSDSRSIGMLNCIIAGP